MGVHRDLLLHSGFTLGSSVLSAVCVYNLTTKKDQQLSFVIKELSLWRLVLIFDHRFRNVRKERVKL